MKRLKSCLILVTACCLGLTGTAQAEEQKMKHFLMIAEPNGDAWKGVIEGGGDMAVPARQAIEEVQDLFTVTMAASPASTRRS